LHLLKKFIAPPFQKRAPVKIPVASVAERKTQKGKMGKGKSWGNNNHTGNIKITIFWNISQKGC